METRQGHCLFPFRKNKFIFVSLLLFKFQLQNDQKLLTKKLVSNFYPLEIIILQDLCSAYLLMPQIPQLICYQSWHACHSL